MISKKKLGFTLVEITIVIAMIAILFASGMFPYSYYMERARVGKAIDMISSEWILAHQDIRGGKVHANTNSNAYLHIELQKGAKKIDFYTSTGVDTEKVFSRSYTFEGEIQILGFTGSLDPTASMLRYLISPPYALGRFSTGSSSYTYLTGVIMTIGYPGASLESGRARNVLLRPYFD